MNVLSLQVDDNNNNVYVDVIHGLSTTCVSGSLINNCCSKGRLVAKGWPLDPICPSDDPDPDDPDCPIVQHSNIFQEYFISSSDNDSFLYATKDMTAKIEKENFKFNFLWRLMSKKAEWHTVGIMQNSPLINECPYEPYFFDTGMIPYIDKTSLHFICAPENVTDDDSCSSLPNYLDQEWIECPKSKYNIEQNFQFQCYERQWKDIIENQHFNGLPHAYWCWSRQVVNQTLLRKNITIASNTFEDMNNTNEIETSFQIVDNVVCCLFVESWAMELISNTTIYADEPKKWLPCITSTGLLANFGYMIVPELSQPLFQLAYLFLEKKSRRFQYIYHCDYVLENNGIYRVKCKVSYDQPVIDRGDEATFDCYKKDSMYNMWRHVYAVPCDNVEQCQDGSDERYCKLKELLLTILLVLIAVILIGWLCLYLFYNVNVTNYDSSMVCQSERMLDISLIVANGDINEIYQLYLTEIEYHGNVANTFCCFKNSLDSETYGKLMNLLVGQISPSRFSLVKLYFKSKWNSLWYEETHTVTRDTNLLFSIGEVLALVPMNIVGPFSYLLDIVKDSLQLILLLLSVGSFRLVLKNWTSFSSVVIEITFLSIVIPLFIAGTLKKRSDEYNGCKRICLFIWDILTAIIEPIRLHFKLVLANCRQQILLKREKASFGLIFKKNSLLIKETQRQVSKHIRLQQGLETIYQLAVTVILLAYAESETKTSQALSGLFKNDGLTVFGIYLSPIALIIFNVTMNIIGFTSANVNGIREGRHHFPAVSTLLLGLCVFCACLTRILGITLYFSPPLGFFNLLFHYKAEMIGFQMLDPYITDGPEYVGPVMNYSYREIQRGTYTPFLPSFSSYQPPSLELYTYFSKQTFFLASLALHFFHVLVNFFLDLFFLKTNTPSSTSLWERCIHSIQQTHFPFPFDDWDLGTGGCKDHIKRKQCAQKEFLVKTAINLIFTLVQLTPMVILYQNISERHSLLETTIGQIFL